MNLQGHSNNPMISIVMPVYNCEPFLQQAIRSVQAQTDPQWDLVIVDDGSTDKTGDIADAFALKDSRIRVIRQTNGGAGAAMKTAIDATRGEWIVVMHGDDEMYPERIEKLRKATTCDSRIGIITAAVTLIGADGRKLGSAKPSLPSNPFFLKDHSPDFIVGGLYHTALRREMVERVGGYNSECPYNEDVDFYNRACDAGYGILILDDTLMKYRIHSGAASTARAKALKTHWRYLKTCIRNRRQNLPEPTWQEFQIAQAQIPWWTRINDLRKDLGQTHYRQAASALSGGRRTAIAMHSAMSLALTPCYFIRKAVSRLH
jgi:glycosyltransferase involved in cell wall biosynthesis